MSRRNENWVFKREKKGDRVFLQLFMYFFTFFCAFDSLRQFNNFTIIEFSEIIGVFFISGLFLGAVTYQYEKRFQGINFKVYDHFVISIIMYGSISCSTFFVLNEYFSGHKEYTQTTLILEKHKSHGRSASYIVVEIDGKERDINLSNKDFSRISLERFVNLKLKKGLFGFLLIKEVKVKY
jgi:hypothetical protein